MSVPIAPEAERFLEELLESRRFSSREQAVNAAILEYRDRFQALRATVKKGIDSADRGQTVEWNEEAFRNEVLSRLLSPERFGACLIKSLDLVAQNAKNEHVGNGRWTDLQWICLGSELHEFLKPESDRDYWIGFRSAPHSTAQFPKFRVGGEWLYDFSLLRYTDEQFTDLLVAAESEWSVDPGEQDDDFIKLLTSTARYKVFVCDPGPGDDDAKKVRRRFAEIVAGSNHSLTGHLWLATWRRSPRFSLDRFEGSEFRPVIIES